MNEDKMKKKLIWMKTEQPEGIKLRIFSGTSFSKFLEFFSWYKEEEALMKNQSLIGFWEIWTQILRSWCNYFMITIVSTDNGYAEFQKHRPTKVSVFVTLLLPLLIQLSLASQPIPAYSVKKDFWFKTSNILSYLCSCLSAACAAFSDFGAIA